MHPLAQLVTEVDPQNSEYQRQFAGCLIKTHDDRLLLQKRDRHFDRFPNTLATFGGQVDAGESCFEGMTRELREELGAKFLAKDALYLGALIKSGLNNAVIHAFWWHDSANSITGCYEGEPAYFNDAADILLQNNITPDVYWIVKRCMERGLI